MSDVKFGTLSATVNDRDAVHVAVITVEAGEILQPGQQVVSARYDNRVESPRSPSQKIVGIVDPFLTEPVMVGQRFWLLLNPGTVLKLRHAWETPEFPEDRSEVEDDGCRGCW